jgi:hypothetical protein
MGRIDHAARYPRVQRSCALEATARFDCAGEALLNGIVRKITTTSASEGEAEEVPAALAVEGFDTSQCRTLRGTHQRHDFTRLLFV